MLRPALRPLLVVSAAAVLPLVACGGDDGADRVAEDRAAQIAAAVEGTGLPDEVVEVLQLAARGATATFQVTYGGQDGAGLVVSQAPPNRRIDVLAGDVIVESTVLRGGVGYLCARDGEDELVCERGAGDLAAPGAFTEDALAGFAAALTESADQLDVSVEDRTIAETSARCLVSTPKAGSVLDAEGPGTDTLCLSDQGAQLLVDSGGERVVADAYSSSVPSGTFDV